MDRSVKAQVFAHTSSCVLSTTTGGRACAIHPNLCQGVLMNLLETYDSLLEDWRTVFSPKSHFRARPPAHLRPAGLFASASDLPSHLRRRASVCRLERRLPSLLAQSLESASSLRSDF